MEFDQITEQSWVFKVSRGKHQSTHVYTFLEGGIDRMVVALFVLSFADSYAFQRTKLEQLFELRNVAQEFLYDWGDRTKEEANQSFKEDQPCHNANQLINGNWGQLFLKNSQKSNLNLISYSSTNFNFLLMKFQRPPRTLPFPTLDNHIWFYHR